MSDKTVPETGGEDRGEGAGEARPGFFREFLTFLAREKKWWLIPLIVVLVVSVLMLVLLEGSSQAPFVYPLF